MFPLPIPCIIRSLCHLMFWLYCHEVMIELHPYKILSEMKFQPQTGVLQTCLSKNLTKVLFSIKRQNTLKCEIILQFNSNDSHEYCLYFQYMASATLEGRVNAIHVLGIQKTVLISPTLALSLSPLCIAIGLKVLWSFSKLPHWVQLTTKHKGTSLNSSSIRSWRLLSNGL